MPQNDKQTQPAENATPHNKTMSESIESWSVIWAVTGLVLGGLVAIVAFLAFFFSWKAGKLKDAELERYKSDASKEVAEAHKEAAQANENTARLEKEAIILRQNHEALKQQVDPRDISDPMRLKFLELTKDAPKGRIGITYVTDGDAKFFALKIGALLNEAGYDAPKSVDEMGAFTGVSPSGVHFKSGDAKDFVGILLQRAFLEIGIESGASVSEYQSGTEIHVGRRQQ